MLSQVHDVLEGKGDMVTEMSGGGRRVMGDQRPAECKQAENGGVLCVAMHAHLF